MVWNRERSNLSFAFLELIPKLEFYLTLTNDDVGIVSDGKATINNPLHDPQEHPSVPSLDKNHYTELKRRPRFSGLTGFSHTYIWAIITEEARMLSCIPRLCPIKYPKQSDNRKLARHILLQCQGVIAHTTCLNDSHLRIGISPFQPLGFTEHGNTDKCRIYTRRRANEPIWESHSEKTELLLQKDIFDKDNLPSNISSVILKIWRMYFTLLEHINHPSPLLAKGERKPRIRSRFYKKNYNLVNGYWQEFGIHV